MGGKNHQAVMKLREFLFEYLFQVFFQSLKSADFRISSARIATAFQIAPGSPELLLNGELLCFHAREPVLKHQEELSFGLSVSCQQHLRLVSLPLSNETRAPGWLGGLFRRP